MTHAEIKAINNFYSAKSQNNRKSADTTPKSL